MVGCPRAFPQRAQFPRLERPMASMPFSRYRIWDAGSFEGQQPRLGGAQGRGRRRLLQTAGGQQAPEYLWIGCSDSRVPANEIVGLDPGELFVHRNVANLAPPQDANYLSVLQFAVDVLKVKHIMVVGHYGCGGVARGGGRQRRGLVDHWLHPIREVYQEHRASSRRSPTSSPPGPPVRAQRHPPGQERRLRRLRAGRLGARPAAGVHGWVYSLADGLVTDLNVTVGGPQARDPGLTAV